MSSENKKKTENKIKNTDVSKKTTSLILNYSSDNPEGPEAPASSSSGAAGQEEEKSNKKSVKKKNKTTKNLSKVAETAEKNKEELKEQVETLKKIKKLLNTEVSTLISMGIQVIKKINRKLFGVVVKEESEEEEQEEAVNEAQEEVAEKPFSFKEFIDMNIIFTDNKKVPLYIAPKKNAYQQNDEILTAATMSKITDVFKETAERLKKVPVPDKGMYEGVPMTEILRNISEDEIYQFLFYVRRFPSKYIGKNYRISESFAAWVMSGTPDN